ncbi:MAG: tRNA pseudouridine(38-40) synthase TruA [Arenicellales bacterium]|nr:tRNA pseudouridine(38-40) synthase TruA [Arenicellales bacterium]
MRIAAGIEYDGSGFKGWQHQDEKRTVQQCLEHAITRVANHPIKVIAAGRTDSGVHATGQVIHFNTAARRTPFQWLRGVNTYLPDDVCLLWVREMTDEFHARYSAVKRSYRYIILNRREPSALFRTRACWEHRLLDVEAMCTAKTPLLGRHDFSSFQAAGCQATSPVRRLSCLDIGFTASWIWFDVEADAFLQHMVRNIVGTLVAVGAGEKSVSWVEEVLVARDRAKAGVTAPPHGLYLAAVSYPIDYHIPESTMAVRYW